MRTKTDSQLLYRYRTMRVNGRKVDLHRYIMELHLGRKLGRNELVHHINGDTLDNRLENLQVLSRSEHSKIHYDPSIAQIKKYIYRGIGHKNSKFSMEDVKRIRSCEGKIGVTELSREYSVDRETIYRIWKNKRYTDKKYYGED